MVARLATTTTESKNQYRSASKREFSPTEGSCEFTDARLGGGRPGAGPDRFDHDGLIALLASNKK